MVIFFTVVFTLIFSFILLFIGLHFFFRFTKKKNYSLRSSRKFNLPVVGESHYQKNLENICGKRTEDGENRIISATLVAEDDNEHDENAICVMIEGKKVGYLGRGDAIKFRKHYRSKPYSSYDCQAQIRGGWERKGGDKGHYGVCLDVDL